MASCLVQNSENSPNEIVRPAANFSPSLWGAQFLDYESDTQAKRELFETVQVLKSKVESMLKTASEGNIVDAIDLIDTLERLGVSYHFEKEIEEIVQQLFNLNTNYEDESFDLHAVALHFRVFRQHGHRISCDIFDKFKDGDGKFHEALNSDGKGLLSLYEAAHLRTHGEDVLEDALAFAKSNLKAMAPNLSSPLRKQVVHALVQPFHFGNPRIEARNFISCYEEHEAKNDILLRFAKLDYNLLQMLHKEELRQVSRWWKELDLISKLPYARDRVVECFFWAMGVYHQPQYSRARIMLTKTIAMTSIIDDTYDSYATIEELDIFTEAIERWDISQIDALPEYLKPLYEALLELYVQFEQEVANEGRSYAVYYAKEALKELVRSYHVEAKWFIQGYLPPFSEYLENALITCTYCYHTTTALLGEESAKEEDFKWLSRKPKMLVASLKVCRLIDDIATYEVEKERGQISTGIESYMKENGVCKEVAVDKFFEIAIDAWKDMNEECLKPSSHPRNVLMHILNLERIIDVTYKGNEDGYTQPEKVLKPHILALFVDPIKN
ncbi:Alpha-humulene/(-)-(E)-beta-caryophyllene synthase [Striga hermonthica]|uniref:Alpha-humulene/(-)-(E)-beta-caryophyllene synthase n=1 Tax=Striga hermonthica TaxID=68872 RepID=A0A9N7RC70_STRHE|nr:Alpha-humulene/(-)-(E)-beta-caryophyllene synthase [Striga hermonthica]